MTWKQVPIDDYDATIKPALANGEGVDCFEVSTGSANGGVSIFGPMAVDMTPALIDVLGEDYADKISEISLTSMTVDGEISADLNQAMMDVLAGVASGTMTAEEAAEELIDAADW